MSAFKSNKRKAVTKVEPGLKNVNKIKSEPLSQPANKKVKLEAGVKTEVTVPKNKNVKQDKPKKLQGTGKLNNPLAKKTETDELSKKTNEISNEAKLNRHKKRRLLCKEKRRDKRDKINELRKLVKQGDASAVNQIREKLASLEAADGPVSKTRQKHLTLYRSILKKQDVENNANSGKSVKTGPQAKIGQKNAQQSSNKKEVQGAKGNLNKNIPKQNGKVAQAKLPVKIEEEDSDEEDESFVAQGDDDDESDAEAEEASEEEDSDDEEASKGLEGEASDDSDDSDDEEEGSEEDDEEGSDDSESPEEQVIPKKPFQQKPLQNNQQTKQPGKQAPQTASSPNKSSKHVVFVGNLAYTSTANDIRDHFKKSGEIVDVRIPTGPEGKPKGFCYVELKDAPSYEKALGLHNTLLGGRKLNVQYTQGGKKNSEKQKGDIKAKNFKLQAMRKQGQHQGGFRGNQRGNARGFQNKNQQKRS